MFDYELYKKVAQIEQQIKKKYQFEKFKMLLTTNEEQSIEFQFKHFDIADKRDVLEGILKDSISLLKKEGYNYKHGIVYPYPLMVSSLIPNMSIPNETTIDYYSLVREDS